MIIFIISYIIHVCMGEAIIGFWKECFLGHCVAPIKVGLLGGLIGCVENLVSVGWI